MNHAEQKALYETDRTAWIKFAAPVIANRMRKADAAEKQRMWDFASPALRAELRRIANGNV